MGCLWIHGTEVEGDAPERHVDTAGALAAGDVGAYVARCGAVIASYV